MHVGTVAVGPALPCGFVNDRVALPPGNVHEGSAGVQLRADGHINGMVLKIDKHFRERAVESSLRVRTSRLYDDVGQAQPLSFDGPMAAEAGVEVKDQAMTVPTCAASL